SQEDHDVYEEQQLGDAACTRGHIGEAEEAGDHGDDEEDDGPLDHADSPGWLAIGRLRRLMAVPCAAPVADRQRTRRRVAPWRGMPRRRSLSRRHGLPAGIR